MDDLHKGANGPSIVDKLEDLLREQFNEKERKWDEQDIRRHELRMKHKECILKRLELQRRAGQMYTAEQVELATAAATSQHMLPAIVRRSFGTESTPTTERIVLCRSCATATVS